MNSGKSFYKIFAVVITVFTLLICFSACGNPNTAPVSDDVSQPEATSQNAETQSAAETQTVSTEEETKSTAPVTGIASQPETASQKTMFVPKTSAETTTSSVKSKNGETQSETSTEPKEEPKVEMLTMKIGNTTVAVDWEDNESVAALRELVKDKPLTVQMSMYGGFEQVGSLGTSLPRNDSQTTTAAGDIVLYSGNQIVVFYGSNSWAYTQLGHVTDKTAAEMAELLGNGNVTITISRS